MNSIHWIGGRLFVSRPKNCLQTSGIDPACCCCSRSQRPQSCGRSHRSYMANLLLDSVPIWSDRRAKEEAADFFQRVDYEKWYMTTGNGDPPETYSVFKLMWLKKHQPDIFTKTKAVLGSKDYINYRLTGQIATDYSYASGSGVFELENWRYSEVLSSCGRFTTQPVCTNQWIPIRWSERSHRKRLKCADFVLVQK